MTILYGNHRIAEIVEDDSDFPTYFGRYSLVEGVENLSDGLIKEYHDYSVATWPLIEEDRFEEIDGKEEERRFGKLIYSDDWWLLTDTHLIPILIPNFCTGGEANWRLDPSRDSRENAEQVHAADPSPAP